MILQLHSYWALLILTLLLFSIVNSILGIINKKDFQDTDFRISLYVIIFTYIQLVIGFAYYFMSPAYKHLKEIGIKAGMKDTHLRLLTIEHPIMMIIAIGLITIGYSKHKKKGNAKAKFKAISIYYGLALLIILSRIPWDQWFN
jgi:cbb3-type cytochrome oxidase subunit 3